MSYIPNNKAPRVGPFFFAYQEQAISNKYDNYILPFSHVLNADSEAVSGGITPTLAEGRSSAYVVGEARTSGDGTTLYQARDFDVLDNTASFSQGFQGRQGGTGHVFYCDDACYGIAKKSVVRVRVGEGLANADFDSNQYETRMTGIVLK